MSDACSMCEDAAPAPAAACERARAKKSLSFEELVAALHEALDGERAEIEHVKELMEAYESNPEDWKKFALLDDFKYTRNLVDDGNGKFNLMLLAWNCGQASSIHDHAGSHCFMKLLGGTLHEELYPKPSDVAEGHELAPNVVDDMKLNSVAYISDEIGMHRISNESHTTPAFSLHLYSPPYSECHSYDERTGKARSSGRMTFFSRNGCKIPASER